MNTTYMVAWFTWSGGLYREIHISYRVRNTVLTMLPCVPP